MYRRFLDKEHFFNFKYDVKIIPLCPPCFFPTLQKTALAKNAFQLIQFFAVKHPNVCWRTGSKIPCLN